MASLYRPLSTSKREIRLLRTRRSGGANAANNVEQRDHLRFGLEAFSLDQMPPFKALSYCWGSGRANQVVHVNDELFYVNSNLFEFLNLVYAGDEDHAESEAIGWIFIDAICIHQNDMDERSFQVTLMGDVYKEAEEVIVWLGVKEANIDGRTILNPVVWQDWYDRLELFLVSVAALEVIGRPARQTVVGFLDASLGTDSVHDLVIPLVQHPFWSRLWIVQEVILARNLSIWYRGLRIAWFTLYECLKYGWKLSIKSLSNQLNFEQTFGLMPDDYYDRYGFDACPLRVFCLFEEKIRSTEVARAHKLKLSSAISNFVRREALIRNDKVYGLLGMTSSVIPIDYGMNVDELYFRALLEGLLEIVDHYDDKPRQYVQRSRAVTEFTTHLAETLGMNLHDPTATIYRGTKYCLDLVGEDIRYVNQTWVFRHLVSFAAFSKFGALSRTFWITATYALSLVSPVTARLCDLFAPITDLESVLFRRKAIILDARCFPKWDFDVLLYATSQLPTMSSADAEDVMLRVCTFSRRKQGVQLAQNALEHIESHLAALSMTPWTQDQAYAQRLEHYAEILKKYIATLTMIEDEPEDPMSPDDVRREYDFRSIAHFLGRHNFVKKLEHIYREYPDMLESVEHNIYEALMLELRSSANARSMILSISLNPQFRLWAGKMQMAYSELGHLPVDVLEEANAMQRNNDARGDRLSLT